MKCYLKFFFSDRLCFFTVPFCLQSLALDIICLTFFMQSLADDLLFFSVIEKDSAQWSVKDIFLHHITSGRDVETE